MGVMCSLLGHDYGDADVERERTEQGDEVVRTAKRVERCHNCGHTRTISENKEVTALEAAAGVVREPDGTVVAARDELSEADGSEQAEDLRITSDERCESDGASTEGGGSLSKRSESNGGEQTDGLRTSSDDQRESDGNIAIENGGEIESALDTPDTDENDPAGENENREVGTIDEIRDTEPETYDGPGRKPGEWPAESADPASNSEIHRNESTDIGSSESLVVESRAGHWPGEADATSESNEGMDRRNATGNGTYETASGASTRTAAGDSFACGSCGFSAAVADSPLRAGDICPGCHRGYLAWETRKG